jgi:uncharacterized membrane protein
MSERRFPWRTLLFVSLAVNLLVIGIVAGAVGAGVRLQREAPGLALSRPGGAGAVLAALPDDTRPMVRRAVRRGWFESREARQSGGQARRDLVEALNAEPFDEARVNDAFARIRAADAAAAETFQAKVTEAFAQMSAEQRREAMTAIMAALRSRRALVGAAFEPAPEDDETPIQPQQR